MGSRGRAVGAVTLGLVLLAMAPPGRTQEASDHRLNALLGVTSASGDASTRVLRIRGRQLLGGAGDAGLVAVRLGGIELAVVSASEEGIEAELPAELGAGRYALLVSLAGERAWGSEVTIAAEPLPISPESEEPLRLREGRGDLSALTLELRGEGFTSPESVSTSVTLSDVPLVLVSTSATLIQAQLPGGTLAGSYRVRVMREEPGSGGPGSAGGARVWTDALDVALVAPGAAGDITAVTTPVSGGLAGGAASGDVSLGLRTCAADQVLKSSGSAWACAADADADTGVNAVVNGGGVTGSIASRTLTLGSTATAANTAGAIVARDGSGNFAAGTITSAGNLALPNTTSASVGVITKGGTPFLHNAGTANTFIGAGAGNQASPGVGNTAVGSNALAAASTGASNSAFGRDALSSNTGLNNSAFGAYALDTNTTGGSNSAFGYSALAANTVGSYNSGFGQRALASNTTGLGNSAFGGDALALTTTGEWNAAFGDTALGSNVAGDNNSAHGSGALSSLATGSDNTAQGYAALPFLASGDRNVAIGSRAGWNLTGGSNNIYIANIGVASESNTIRIGESQSATYIDGISGATSASGVAVFVNSTGKLGTVTSSARYKEGIADMARESEVLMKLRPVSFYYRDELDETHTRQYGLVAEEVAEVAPELVVRDEAGAPQTVRYHFVNAMLLNEVQRQQRRLETQEAELRELRAEVAALAARQGRE